MFKERLLLGQYYPVESCVQRLTAQSKIIITLLYMITLFVANNWLGWGILTAICLAAIGLSKIPLKALWRGLKIIAVFALLTLVINILVYPGDTVWLRLGSLRFTAEGLSYGLAMALRLLLLVAFASLLTLTTPPLALADGLENILAPLRCVKVPAHDIAMMMSIALRFIPTILEEFDRLILVQKARGADFGKNKLIKRIRSFIPLLVPLFVSSFRRADDLAQAMEAKCYRGGEGRTRWKSTVWQYRDTIALIFFTLLLAGAIMGRVLG